MLRKFFQRKQTFRKIFNGARRTKKPKPLSFEKFNRIEIPVDKQKAEIKEKVKSEQTRIIEAAKSFIFQQKNSQDSKISQNFKFSEEAGTILPVSTTGESELKPNQLKTLTLSNLKKLIMDTPIPPEKLTIKGEEIRVSKYLSRASVASRKQAERLISRGFVRVNNKVVKENKKIDPLKDKVEIFSKNKWSFSGVDSAKLWVFYKPRGLLCDRRNRRIPGDKRMDIYQYLDGVLGIDHFITVVSSIFLIYRGGWILIPKGFF